MLPKLEEKIHVQKRKYDFCLLWKRNVLVSGWMGVIIDGEYGIHSQKSQLIHK
jgi:hypothetical protein